MNASSRTPRRRCRSVGDAIALAALAAPCIGGANAVMRLTPWAGWAMWTLAASALVLAIDGLLGDPLIRAYVDARRRLRGE